MPHQTISPGNYISGADVGLETQRSGVSWAAILAGAAAAAAVSLVLVLLGSGLGFSALSPYENNSAVAFGVTTILWISFTQVAASALGGYIAGRLRVKWATVHTDEVYFRDTAHGMLAWAVATLLTAALFTGALGSALSGVAKATVASGAAAVSVAGNNDGAGASVNPLDYFSDMLMRTGQPAADARASDSRAEVVRIFTTSLANGSMAADDRAYLAQTVAARTGVEQADAERRVDEVYNRAGAAAAKARASATEVADKARKAAAAAALWMTVALLLGAFVASLAATLGGKQRDRVAHTMSPLNR